MNKRRVACDGGRIQTAREQHDGHDRWYLEALGVGADQQWDAFLDAYLAKSGEAWKTPAGRDIIWRSRGKQTPALLVKILKDPATKEDEQLRYFRALDFLSGAVRCNFCGPGVRGRRGRGRYGH